MEAFSTWKSYVGLVKASSLLREKEAGLAPWRRGWGHQHPSRETWNAPPTSLPSSWLQKVPHEDSSEAGHPTVRSSELWMTVSDVRHVFLAWPSQRAPVRTKTEDSAAPGRPRQSSEHPASWLGCQSYLNAGKKKKIKVLSPYITKKREKHLKRWNWTSQHDPANF